MKLLNKEKMIEYYYSHKGEAIGAMIGLTFALGVLLLGIFKLIFISICIFAGYYIGKKIHKDPDLLRKIRDRIKDFFER